MGGREGWVAPREPVILGAMNKKSVTNAPSTPEVR